jgi:hypothetical protein
LEGGMRKKPVISVVVGDPSILTPHSAFSLGGGT